MVASKCLGFVGSYFICKNVQFVAFTFFFLSNKFLCDVK